MKTSVRYVDPPNTPPAQGLYSHVGVAPAGDLLFIAGQLAVGLDGKIVGKNDFEAQYRQIFSNMGNVLKGMNLDFTHIIKFTTFFVHSQDIETFMRLRAETFPEFFQGNKFPPNTIVVIDRLVKEEFLLEVEAVAQAGG